MSFDVVPHGTVASTSVRAFCFSVVDGGPVAMGAEEEASSVEPVAPPPATKSRTSHHNCFGLPYQVCVASEMHVDPGDSVHAGGNL